MHVDSDDRKLLTPLDRKLRRVDCLGIVVASAKVLAVLQEQNERNRELEQSVAAVSNSLLELSKDETVRNLTIRADKWHTMPNVGDGVETAIGMVQEKGHVEGFVIGIPGCPEGTLGEEKIKDRWMLSVLVQNPRWVFQIPVESLLSIRKGTQN